MAQAAKLTSQQVIDTLEGHNLLPHLPSAMIELQRALQDPEVHGRQIEEIIMKDSRLTVAILQTANTAKFSNGQKISSLGEAISRLGITEINNIAYQASLSGLKLGCKTVNSKSFLKNALLTGYIAKDLAKTLSGGLTPSNAFLCGIFHDMGVPLMDVFCIESFNLTQSQLDQTLTQQVTIERYHFGFSHSAVGGTLIRNWEFPSEIIMGVAGHHTPNKLQGLEGDYAHLTFLAEFGSRLKGFDYRYFAAEAPDLDEAEASLDHFGLDMDYYLNLVDEALDTYEGSVVI